MGLFFHMLLPLHGCCTGFSVCRPVSGNGRNRVLIPGHHIEVQAEEFITVHLGNQRHVIAESAFYEYEEMNCLICVCSERSETVSFEKKISVTDLIK